MLRDKSQVHPKVQKIIDAFETKELHASRSGREVMQALGSVIAETEATSLDHFSIEFDENISALADALQTYAPTMNVLHSLYTSYDGALSKGQALDSFQVGIAGQVEGYLAWSQEARSRIAAIGKKIIPMGSSIYTFTLSETVMRTLLEAWDGGIEFRVFVTESRPNNDGRATGKALADAGIPVEVSIDACMDELIARADLMIVGAEAILADGSAVCKIGTYPAALVAHQSRVPLYVVVDTMKFYVNSSVGKGITLDNLDQTDVIGTEFSTSPRVDGHLFDRTPPEYISGLITELGIMHPSQASLHMLTMPISAAIVNRVQ